MVSKTKKITAQFELASVEFQNLKTIFESATNRIGLFFPCPRASPKVLSTLPIKDGWLNQILKHAISEALDLKMTAIIAVNVLCMSISEGNTKR